MFDRFDDRAKRAMSNSRKAAGEFHHDRIDTGHMLLALVRDEGCGAVAILAELGVDPGRVQSAVEQTMTPGPEATTPAQLPFTPGAKNVLEISFHTAHLLGHNWIGTEHLLIGLVRGTEGVAASVVAELGLDADRVEESVRRRHPPQPIASPSLEAAAWVMSQAMQDAIGGSLHHLRGPGVERVDVPHFLLGLLDQPGYLSRLLERLGLDPARVRATILEDLRGNQ